MTEAQAAVSWAGRHAIVALPAEIDISNSDEVYGLLVSVIGQDPETVTVDLSGTRFCDSAGVRAIVQASRQARSHGTELRLAVGQSPVTRVLTLTGLDQILPLYRDVQHSRDTPRASTHGS